MKMEDTVVFLILLIVSVRAASHDSVHQLSQKILSGYKNMVRGSEDLSQRTYVDCTFQIVRIVEYNEVSGKLAIAGFFFLQWQDYRMKWDPDQYDGTRDIMFLTKDVWTPNIFLTTAHSNFRKLGNDDLPVRFDSEGKSFWYPADVFTCSCTPDIYYFPYDTQECVIFFSFWAYRLNEVGFRTLFREVNTNYYSEHGLWNLTSTSTGVLESDTVNAFVIELTLTRMPTFYLINMILPIIIIGLLNIFVFLLPAESGERVSYSITVLLAIAVFQTMASDKLPSVSRPQVSLLCIKLLIDLLLSVLVTTLTIVSLYFYDMPKSRRVPVCVRAICSAILCRRCCSKKSQDRYEKEETYEIYKVVNGQKITASISLSNHHTSEVTASENNDITWSDVGRCSDIVFSIFSLLAFFASNLAFLLLVKV